jgi:membrane protein YqaA with SNARE-associated domain
LDQAWELLILFAASFLAATVIPAQSEAVLVGLYTLDHHPAALLVTVATFGNVLGACTNWVLGAYLMQFKDRPWFPIKGPALGRAEHTYRRWGAFTLLLSWVPIIGDPLTMIAGVFRTKLPLFVVMVTAGKLARYVAIIALL